ncbi:MAG: transglutaminase domain-containing protein [Bacteroidota bacterium]
MPIRPVPFLIILYSAVTTLASAGIPDSVRVLIDHGEYTHATASMEQMLRSGTVPREDSSVIAFEIERLVRVRKDFVLTASDIDSQLRNMYGDSAYAFRDRYTQDGSLEMKLIDGVPRYFKQAVPNLFRVNPEAKSRKPASGPDSLERFLRKEIPAELHGLEAGNPKGVTIRYRYTLTVHPDAVPAGETLRCWLPYPRTDVPRQTAVRLLGSSVPGILSAGSDPAAHSSLYLEETARAGEPTVFWVEAEYRSFPERVGHDGSGGAGGLAGPRPELCVGERPPHIVFTDAVKELNRRIVGKTSSKREAAQKIYRWISDSIPWASAREYSTIRAIAPYCLEQRHGDCGIQTMLFMTLCRLNGIATHWQSGWMMHPGNVDMHDWCEISLDGQHWVPVDQSFGIQRWTRDPDERWFYWGGIDAYRLILNQEYSAPLFPPKVFPRSETVDFQRGEAEWKGGNLYFDQWDYSMKVSYP